MVVFGLAALAKMTERNSKEVPGRKISCPDMQELQEVKSRMIHAEAAYAGDNVTWSQKTGISEHCILDSKWNQRNKFYPAFVASVGYERKEIIIAVRGTSDTLDFLINAAAHPQEFAGGFVHSGFLLAAAHLLLEIESLLDEGAEWLERHWAKPPELYEERKASGEMQVVFVGHSLGGAVAVLSSLLLREPDLWSCALCLMNARGEGMRLTAPGEALRRKLDSMQMGFHVRSWAFAPPAFLSADLAKKCGAFSTSVLSSFDLVPRLSLSSVGRLRETVLEAWKRRGDILDQDGWWLLLIVFGIRLLWSLATPQESQESIVEGGTSKIAQERRSIGKGLKSALASAGHSTVKGMEEMEASSLSVVQPPTHKAQSDSGGGIPPLYPPSRLLVLTRFPGRHGQPTKDATCSGVEATAKEPVWVLSEANPEDFKDILVTRWCVADHNTSVITQGMEHVMAHHQ